MESAINYLSEAYFGLRRQNRDRRIDKIYISTGLYDAALLEISKMSPGREQDSWRNGLRNQNLFVQVPNSSSNWIVLRTSFKDELPPDEVQDVDFDL